MVKLTLQKSVDSLATWRGTMKNWINYLKKLSDIRDKNIYISKVKQSHSTPFLC